MVGSTGLVIIIIYSKKLIKLKNSFYSEKSFDKKALIIRMAIGGLFNLILVSVFIFMGPPGHAEWGKFWVVRPVCVMTLAGLTGGSIFYYMTHYLQPVRWKKAVAFFGSGLIYIIGLWMGMVLGFVGTWWN